MSQNVGEHLPRDAFLIANYYFLIVPPDIATQDRTHVFIRGQVGSDQVCVEAWEAQDGPDWEETYHQLHCSERLGQGEHQEWLAPAGLY